MANSGVLCWSMPCTVPCSWVQRWSVPCTVAFSRVNSKSVYCTVANSGVKCWLVEMYNEAQWQWKCSEVQFRTVDVRQYQSNFGQVGWGRGDSHFFLQQTFSYIYIQKKMYMKLNNNRLPSPLFWRNISEREIRDTRVKLKLKEYYAPPPRIRIFMILGFKKFPVFSCLKCWPPPPPFSKTKLRAWFLGFYI